jgi:hypothetical protein
VNFFDDRTIAEQSFAVRDLLDIDRWESFVVIANLTVVGTPTYIGRYRIVGKQCFFQISAVSSTSIASTAGTHYFSLPIAAKGVAGVATMTDNTTNIAVGACHIDVANSRCYVPTQGASANTFAVVGWFEIG